MDIKILQKVIKERNYYRKKYEGLIDSLAKGGHEKIMYPCSVCRCSSCKYLQEGSLCMAYGYDQSFVVCDGCYPKRECSSYKMKEGE